MTEKGPEHKIRYTSMYVWAYSVTNTLKKIKHRLEPMQTFRYVHGITEKE